MYVSSYNTYINTNNSEKSTFAKAQKSKAQTASFLSHLNSNEVLNSKKGDDLPINYISNSRISSNKQKLQNEIFSQSKVEYSKKHKIQTAKTAYEDNSKMFSLFMEPKNTQSQVLHVDKSIQHVAINTYLQNDKYHQITA